MCIVLKELKIIFSECVNLSTHYIDFGFWIFKVCSMAKGMKTTLEKKL